jgi:TolA-binding protein
MIRSTSAFALAATIVFTAPPATAQRSQPRDDQAVLRDYLAGNGLLNRGLNDLAAAEYRKFLAAHTNHEKAPVARYGLSVALYRLKQFKDATAELEQLAAIDSFEFAAEVGLMLGQSHLALGDPAASAAALARALEQAEAHALADDIAALLGESLYRAGRYAEVPAAVDFIVSSHADSPVRDRAELFAGMAEMAIDRPADAAERFEGMLERAPRGPMAPRVSFMLARCLQQTEDLEQAARLYANVIESGAAEFLPDSLYALGAIQRRSEEPKEAIAMFDRFLKEFEDHDLAPAVRFERARAMVDAESFEDALEAMADADGMPEDLRDDAAYWAAKCELRLDRPDDAATRLAAGISRHRESDVLAEMRYDRAIALLRAGDNEQALDAFREFRSNHGDHEMAAESLRLIAFTTHQMGDYRASDTACGEFLTGYPTHAAVSEITFLTAENAFLAGDFETAAVRYASFRESFDAADDGRSALAAFRLGLALHRLNRADDARPLLESVIAGENTPAEFAPALLALGDIHFGAGDWSAADERLSQYLALGDALPPADDAMLKIGIARQRMGEGENALAAFDRLLASFPLSAHRLQAIFERGQTLRTLGRIDEARGAFESVLESGGESRFAPFSINHLASIAMSDDRFAEAVGLYERLEASAATDAMKAESVFQRAQALMALERHADAAAAFAAYAATNPSRERAALASANRALCLAREGRHEEAIEAIRLAESEHGDALAGDMLVSLAYERAWSSRAMADGPGAVAAYNDVLTHGTSHRLAPFARVELAELHASEDRIDEAAALLDPMVDAIDAAPVELRERALYRAAACAYERDQFKRAAEVFELFLKDHKESDLAPSAMLLAGESLFRLEKHPRAAELLAEAIERSEDDDSILAPALLRRGECLAATQQWKASEEAFAAYLKRFADTDSWFQARFGVGWALENQGKHEPALEAYRDVVTRHQGPTAARAQFQIGECLFAQRKYDEAARELLKVDILYAYDQWSAAALYDAGRCFEAMAQPAEARRQFEQVRDRFGDTEWATLARERLAALSQSNLPGRDGG